MENNTSYSISEVAGILKLSAKTIRRYIKAGKLPSIKVPTKFGDEYRVTEIPEALKQEAAAQAQIQSRMDVVPAGEAEKGLDEMVNIQYVHSDPQIYLQKFWWFPYSGGMVKGMQAGMTFLFDRNILRKLAALPAVLMHFPAYLLKNSRRKEKL